MKYLMTFMSLCFCATAQGQPTVHKIRTHHPDIGIENLQGVATVFPIGWIGPNAVFVTAAHSINPGEVAEVSVNKKFTIALLKSIDYKTDVALLEVPTKNIKPFRLASSSPGPGQCGFGIAGYPGGNWTILNACSTPKRSNSSLVDQHLFWVDTKGRTGSGLSGGPVYYNSLVVGMLVGGGSPSTAVRVEAITALVRKTYNRLPSQTYEGETAANKTRVPPRKPVPPKTDECCEELAELIKDADNQTKRNKLRIDGLESEGRRRAEEFALKADLANLRRQVEDLQRKLDLVGGHRDFLPSYEQEVEVAGAKHKIRLRQVRLRYHPLTQKVQVISTDGSVVDEETYDPGVPVRMSFVQE